MVKTLTVATCMYTCITLIFIIVFYILLMHIIVLVSIACDSQLLHVYFSTLNLDIPLSLFRTIISVSEKGPLPTV